MNAIKIEQSTVLAQVPSESNPSKFYTIKLGADGVTYCNCMAWRMQHNHPSNRSCKHLVAFKSKTIRNFDPSQEPVAIRPVRSSRKVAVSVPAPEAYRPTSWERL